MVPLLGHTNRYAIWWVIKPLPNTNSVCAACPRSTLTSPSSGCSNADAVIGGTPYSDSLFGPTSPAPTYLDMLRHNPSEVAKAFTS